MTRPELAHDVRLIDTTQAINRLNEYDFDMIIGVPAQSISPGNEQRDLFGSAAADRGLEQPAEYLRWYSGTGPFPRRKAARVRRHQQHLQQRASSVWCSLQCVI